MFERLSIKLTSKEREALQTIAENEMRDFRDQARFFIRQELERRGLITDPKPSISNNQAVGNDVC